MQIEIKASEKYQKTAPTTAVVDRFLVCLMKCSSNDLSASSTHFEPHFTGRFISNNGRSDLDNFFVFWTLSDMIFVKTFTRPEFFGPNFYTKARKLE